MTIPVTLIWSTLNRFLSSVSSVLDLELKIGQEIFKQISDGRYQIVHPKIPRRDETTSKNLGRLFGRCQVTDGCLPTLSDASQSNNNVPNFFGKQNLMGRGLIYSLLLQVQRSR